MRVRVLRERGLKFFFINLNFFVLIGFCSGIFGVVTLVNNKKAAILNFMKDQV